MKQWNRLLCVLVLLALALAGLQVGGTPASAAEIVASGDLGAEGSSITWTLDSEATLTLSGTGETVNYETRVAGGDPWAYVNINRIVVEPGITKLGDGIFANLGNVDEISLPDTLTTIGAYCFQSTRLPEVRLPASVTSLGAMCFRDCPTSVWFYGDMPEGLFSYDAHDYESWHYYTRVTVYYPSWNVTWNSVALNGVDDAYVTLKDNGTEPDKTVYFDKTYENGLHVTVTKDGYATITGTGESVLTAGYYPHEARHVVIGEGVIAVADSCPSPYMGTRYTQTLEIGDSVTEIGEEAFMFCQYLTTVKFGSGITEIGRHSFKQCYALKDVWFYCANPGLSHLYTTRFDENTFTLHYPDWDMSWTEEELPGMTVTWQAESGIPIPEGAETVIVDTGDWGSLDWTLSRTGVLTVSGEGEMDSNHYTEYTPMQEGADFAKKIRSVIIESGITSIGSRCFAGAPNLTTVVIGDTVTSIGSEAFYNCAITDLTLPQGLEDIGSSAFYGSPIANLQIPDSVQHIYRYAFRGHQTEKIVLPRGLTLLGTESFESDVMTELWLYGSKPEELYWNGSNDYYNPNIYKQNLPYGADWAGTVYFPQWNVTWAGYDTRTNGLNATWQHNGTEEEAVVLASGTCDTGDTGDEISWTVTADGVLTLSGHGTVPAATGWGTKETAYSHQAENIRHVVIESGITGLGNRFLTQLSNLETVTLPDTLETIQGGAFADAKTLTSLELPASVRSIGDQAFSGSGLTSLRFLGSVPQEMAQNCCNNLVGLTLSYPAGDHTWKGWIGEGNQHSFSMGSGDLTTVGEAGEVAEYVWKSGEYGTGFTWSLTNMGKLTIEGEEGNAYNSNTFPNWVREVVVNANVNYFNWNAYSALSLETVHFSYSAPEFIGTLNGCDATVYYPAWDMSWYEELRNEQGDSLVWEDNGSEVVERIILSGACGENLTYALNNLGVLAIEGSGQMYNFTNFYEEYPDEEYHSCPWINSRVLIHELRLPEGLTSIGREAFSDLANLTSLTLPESVTTIGDYAFDDCRNLTELVLPSGLESIGSCAFSNCGITQLVIPDTVTTIGTYALQNCKTLTSVTLPAGLTELGEGTFYGCEALTTLELPQSLTSIGNFVFNFSGLKSIVIPESVNRIGVSVFRDCPALTEVVLPSQVEEFGANMFTGCSALTSVNLPENLTVLPEHTFRGCSALASITLPEGLTTIGTEAFRDCTSLTELILPQSLTLLQDHALQNTGLTAIDLTGTEFGEGLLMDCAQLTNVTLPEIQTLPRELFSGCTSLTVVEIPDSVRYLRYNVFAGCTSLEKINFHGNVPEVYYNEEYDYDLGETVTKTSFGGIRATIFYPGWDIRWQMLDRDLWDSGLYWQSNGDEADPQPLDSGTCGGSVRWSLDSAGTLVFSGSGEMSDYIIYYGEDDKLLDEPIPMDTPWQKYKPYIRTVVINDGVTRLGVNALRNCSRLQTVTFPAANCTIPPKSFLGTGSPTLIFPGDPLTMYPDTLTGITATAKYPDYFTWVGKTNNYGGSITWEKQASEAVDDPAIVAQAYSHFLIWKLDRDGQLTMTTRNLAEGELLDPMTCFGNQGSYPWDSYKDSITAITLGDGLSHVPFSAFDHCRLLTSLTLADSIQCIRSNAFENCELLTEVRLGKDLVELGRNAFANCTGLTTVYMGESLNQVDSSAFAQCGNLHTIHVPSLQQWMENACLNVNFSEGRGYDLYIAGSPAEHIVLPGTMELITRTQDWGDRKGYFDYCTNLKQITISEGVKEIGAYTLANIPNLTTVVIPGSVATIGKSPFYQCEELEKIFFTGLAPLFDASTFSNLELTAYYPGSNPSWTEAKRQDYGGGIRWVDSEAPHTHSYGDWAVSLLPGCETEGQQSRSCSICGDTETQSVPAAGHSYGQWETISESTCATAGVQKRFCQNCDAFEEQSLPLGEHSYDEGVMTEAPTCETNGSKTFTCTVCDDSYVEVILTEGHTFGEWNETPATCTGTGSRTAECTVCGETVTEELPAAGHSFGDWVITKPATGEEEGQRQRTCTACGVEETEVIPIVTITFGDVKDGDWFAPMVNWAVAKGITSGVGDNNFAPLRNCTRAQVVTFLWRAQGCPKPTMTEHPFTDVAEGDYFYEAVLWAVENNITTGTSATTFGPNADCTRGQVVTFLWRANGKPAPTGTNNPFADVPEGAYFYEPVLWAVENGITSGMDADSFAPNGICNRAQVVTFLYRNSNQ